MNKIFNHVLYHSGVHLLSFPGAKGVDKSTLATVILIALYECEQTPVPRILYTLQVEKFPSQIALVKHNYQIINLKKMFVLKQFEMMINHSDVCGNFLSIPDLQLSMNFLQPHNKETTLSSFEYACKQCKH